MSAVGCCGQPPCVAVATARCRGPTADHSTALTFTSLLSLSLAAAGVGSPAPRLHAHHSAAPGAPWRREAHRRAVRSSRGAVCRHLHTTQPQPHTGTTLTLTTFTTFSLSSGALHGGSTVDGSAPCWGGGRIHFQNTVNTEYAANFWRGRLEVVRAIFAVISSTL